MKIFSISKSLYFMKVNMAPLFLMAILSIMNVEGILAQKLGVDTIYITLEEAISEARNYNLNIKEARQNIAVQKASHDQTRAFYLPHFNASISNLTTNNPLYSFGFKLLQETVSEADFSPSVLNDPDIINQFSLQMHGVMPLYNKEGKLQREAASKKINIAQHMAVHAENGIELEVKKAFYNLILAKQAVQVMNETHDAAIDNYQIAENNFNQGLLLKSNLLQAQVMVNQSLVAFRNAETNLLNGRDYFKYIIGNQMSSESVIIPSQELSEKISEDQLDQTLSESRADLRAAQVGITALEDMMEASRAAFVPKINAIGSFEFNDNTPFAMGANNFIVGIRADWNIFNGGKNRATTDKTKAQIIAARVDYQNTLNKNRLDIISTKRKVTDTNEQIKLNKLSIRQAMEVQQITKNRFKQGLEKTTDLINTETTLAQTKLQLSRSIYDLNIQIAMLEYLTK